MNKYERLSNRFSEVVKFIDEAYDFFSFFCEQIDDICMMESTRVCKNLESLYKKSNITRSLILEYKDELIEIVFDLNYIIRLANLTSSLKEKDRDDFFEKKLFFYFKGNKKSQTSSEKVNSEKLKELFNIDYCNSEAGFISEFSHLMKEDLFLHPAKILIRNCLDEVKEFKKEVNNLLNDYEDCDFKTHDLFFKENN